MRKTENERDRDRGGQKEEKKGGNNHACCERTCLRKSSCGQKWQQNRAKGAMGVAVAWLASHTKTFTCENTRLSTLLRPN